MLLILSKKRLNAKYEGRKSKRSTVYVILIGKNKQSFGGGSVKSSRPLVGRVFNF
jgi:hypothetical protein